MKTPKIMFLYSAFVFVCGLIAFFMAPPNAKATTALVIPSIAAALMAVCGVMAMMLPRNRIAGIIGIHAGMFFAMAFAVAFTMRAVRTFQSGDESKQYLAIILLILGIASLAAFALLVMNRPKQADRVA